MTYRYFLISLSIMGILGITHAATRCIPEERWREHCNFCVCGRNGYPYCTRMLCDDARRGLWRTSKKDAPRCVPGEDWTEDCSTCVCNQNGHPVCKWFPCNIRREITMQEGQNINVGVSTGTKCKSKEDSKLDFERNFT